MDSMNSFYRSADWKSEKHVPVIDAPEQVAAGEECTVTIAIGKEIPHPNKTEHHIRWIELYFKPDGATFPVQIGRVDFTAHGEAVEGLDQSGIYTSHCAVFRFKTNRSGTLAAGSYCNIHGLWENSRPLTVG